MTSMRLVREVEDLTCDGCGERLVKQEPFPPRLQDLPRTGEYVRGFPSFAHCDNGDCPKAGVEIPWGLIPYSRLGPQLRHLGGLTYDGSRVLPDTGDRDTKRRPATDPDTGYYGDVLKPGEEPKGERKTEGQKKYRR